MRTNSPKTLLRDRNKKWEYDGVLLPDVSQAEVFDISEFFADPAVPLEIEIGVGKGTFLVARAAYRPEVNFLGIEYAAPYAKYAADRIRRAGLTNAKMLHADAERFFKKLLPDNSVFRVHLYFPDPWPKRRHHRRRILQPEFLQHVRRVLKPGGQFLIVTDHREYFEHMLKVITDAEGFARTDFPKLLDSDVHIVGTNFEKKYVEQGRNFYKAALLKYVR
ncbi:MAG TPA: tRNA (guanosine(46)-N7)-methyltransferase TrmB [Phycisphaerae bacterium]|nr:tRNA (guanosine(46)-N7)-methyltransferase TrmB [Phycisphaerae bacterium]